MTTDEAYAVNDVASLLLNSGYSREDIALLKKKVSDERGIYTSEIFDKEFFKD